jgi:hypothetical protein
MFWFDRGELPVFLARLGFYPAKRILRSDSIRFRIRRPLSFADDVVF